MLDLVAVSEVSFTVAEVQPKLSICGESTLTYNSIQVFAFYCCLLWAPDLTLEASESMLVGASVQDYSSVETVQGLASEQVVSRW